MKKIFTQPHFRRLSQYCALLLLSLFADAFSLSAQSYEWATCAGGARSQAYSVTVDPKGNVYSCGYFSGTVDFDPGPGVFDLTSTAQDVFLQKLDATGNFVWAYKFGGIGNDIGKFVKADSSGYIYVGGNFMYTSDFDPGTGIYNLVSKGMTDAFILKLDTAGNFVWAGSIGSDKNEAASAITISSSENIYVCGNFQDTTDFDPGPGTYNMIVPGSANTNLFVVKLSPSGGFVFAKNIGETAASGMHNGGSVSIGLDGNNNIYNAGNFKGTLDFDPGSGTYTMTSTGPLQNTFISKLDSAGNFIWAKQMGGSAAQCIPYAMAIDKTGNAYLTGIFSYSIDIDPGPGTFALTCISTTGLFNSFIEKLGPAGNFIWGKRLASTQNIINQGLCLDRSGDINVCGFFSDSVDFDPGPGTFYLAAPPGTAIYDCYVERLDSGGNFLNAFKIHGSTDAQAAAITVDPKKTIYVVGYITGTYDFDPTASTFMLASATPTVNVTFTAKYNQTKYGLDTVTACGSYTSGTHTWTIGGSYLDTLTASDGPDSIVSLTLTINPVPSAGSITGADTVCVGADVTLSAAVAGGTWGIGSTAYATVTGGIVSGTAPGADTVFYTVTDATTGCSAVVAHPIFVKACSDVAPDQIPGLGTAPGYAISPNPNKGSFRLLCPSTNNEPELIVTNMAGQVVQKFTVKTNQEYILSPNLPQGLYMLHIKSDNGNWMQKMVVIR
jgi:hypothetical protein